MTEAEQRMADRLRREATAIMDTHPGASAAMQLAADFLDQCAEAEPVARICTDAEMRHRDPRWGRVKWIEAESELPEGALLYTRPAPAAPQAEQEREPLSDDWRELLELAAKAAGMVDYNPVTGVMTWKSKSIDAKDSARWNARYAGKECGTVDDKGYRRILFRFGKTSAFRIRTHRLAWFIAYGVLPTAEIDHINQDKSDNRLSNLRDVPKELNQRNGTRKSNNTSGVPGVTWHKQRGKWCAQVNVLGIHYHVGLFDDIENADKAVREFRATHGFTENHGRVV